MSKNFVILVWITTIGSIMWLLSKAKPESLLADWFNYIVLLVTAIFAGHILIKLISFPSHLSQWKSLSKMVFPFFTGVICLACGVVFSATNFLGNQWVGFGLSVFGMVYYSLALARFERLYKQLDV